MLKVTCCIAGVLIVIRYVYSAFAAAFVAPSAHWRMAVWLLQSRCHAHDIRRFQAGRRLNDLSHSYISTRRYAIPGPLLWYIGPGQATYQG